MTATTTAPSHPRRWDAIVRLTHWSIVAAVMGNAIFTEGGSDLHLWIGYALSAMLALRLLWGLIGPLEARFSAFPPSLRRALAHIREIRAGEKHEYTSHNPLGALMVYAVWACLVAIIATGIAMAGLPGTPREAANHSVTPYTQDERGQAITGAKREEQESEEGPFGEVHELAVNLLYVLIALHLAGVAFETRRSGRQLVLAMLPGRR